MKRFLPLVAFVSTLASAQTYDYAKRFGIGAGYGREFPLFDMGPIEGHTDKSSDWTNLHGRYHLDSAGAIVFTLSRANLPSSKINADTYEFSYLYRLQPGERFSWVIGAGIGALDYTKLKGDSNWWRLTGKLRVGVEYSLTQNLLAAFNVDLGYINNAINDGGDHEQINLTPHVNLTWFFGCGEACEKKETPQAAPAQVAAPVAATAKPDDGDLDKDGVSDSKDKCPGSPANSKVNAYGCVPKEKAHIEVEVHFASSSATLSSESHQAVDELAAFLKEHPETKAEIQGHTDSSGNPVKNKILSQQRADAVKNYLVNYAKITEGRLHSVGYGSEKPIADNKTVEGRTQNRRVMAVIEE
jgi:OmpA-OmpF porin, OOP family